MLVYGQPFNVSTIRNVSLRRLSADAGNCTLLPEFRPVRFPHSRYIWPLLHHGFYCEGICYFLASTFMFYMAVVFISYMNASLFVAMTDCPLLRRISDKILTPWTISTSMDFSLNMSTWTQTMKIFSTIFRATILGCRLFFI
jgi:hypothetical protein